MLKISNLKRLHLLLYYKYDMLAPIDSYINKSVLFSVMPLPVLIITQEYFWLHIGQIPENNMSLCFIEIYDLKSKNVLFRNFICKYDFCGRNVHTFKPLFYITKPIRVSKVAFQVTLKVGIPFIFTAVQCRYFL